MGHSATTLARNRARPSGSLRFARPLARRAKNFAPCPMGHAGPLTATVILRQDGGAQRPPKEREPGQMLVTSSGQTAGGYAAEF